MWGVLLCFLHVGHFPTPLFGSLSVQYLMYMAISLIFSPNYFSTVFHRVLSLAWCVNEVWGGLGWGRMDGVESFTSSHAK